MSQILQRTAGVLTVSLMLGASAISPATAAPGWSLAGVPTSIQIVRNEGFILNGAFGNSGTTPCTVPDALWVPMTHPQYQSLLSASLTAVAAGMKIRGYAHACTAVGWTGGTYNEVSAGGALIITK